MTLTLKASTRFVAYYRVSTDKQGRSGLGLDAQREAVARHAAGSGGAVAAAFDEVESGKRGNRPQLARALAECRLRRGVLLIAKLDRLARDAHFLLGLEKAGVEFVAADMPHANRLTVGIMALVAEEEARADLGADQGGARRGEGARREAGRQSRRPEIDPALGRAARTRLADDYACQVGPVALAVLQEAGAERSYGRAAAVLTTRGIRTPLGGKWTRAAVRSLIQRHLAQLPARERIPLRLCFSCPRSERRRQGCDRHHPDAQ